MSELGPYRDLVPIGRGGMGTVFRARSPDAREVAVKLLSKLDPDARARFDRERRLLASFSEADGFVPFLDAGDSPHGPWLVMPLVSGGTLRAKLAGGPLGVDETVELGRALAQALGRAHERGVVHRDLKPENVLFTAEGKPLIADLGLAKHFDRAAKGATQSVSLSVGGTFRGTAGYMSPEQMEDAKSAGPPADIFALGAVLYECLAGRPAFEGETRLDVMAKAGEARFAPVKVLAPLAPAWLASVVERALARAPEERFQDGRELARALDGGSGRTRWRRLVAGTALALLGAAAVTWLALRPAGASAEELVRSANAKGARKDWDAALADATRAIELDATLAWAWETRALARENKGDFAGALEDTTRALQIDPGRANAWGIRGCARASRGDNAGAIPDLTRAVTLDPKLAFAWGSRGAARHKMGDRAGANEDFTKALALDPELAQAWSNRGAVRVELGDNRGAIEDLTRAITLAPRLAVAWMMRGNARDSVGDSAAAIEDYTQAVALAPGLALAWANLGAARFRRGEHAAAIDATTRALALDPKLDVAWETRALSHMELREDDDAIADATRAIDLAPKLAYRAWEARGGARARKGDNENAIKDLTQVVELAPENPTGWLNRAVAKRNNRDLVGAASDFRRYLDLEPRGPQAQAIRDWLANSGL